MPDVTSFLDFMMGHMTPAQFWPALVQIMIVNIILSGDNAVVIALACRSLPKSQRMWGIVLGALVAVVMRVVFTVGVTTLLATPWLKVIGSVLLLPLLPLTLPWMAHASRALYREALPVA